MSTGVPCAVHPVLSPAGVADDVPGLTCASWPTSPIGRQLVFAMSETVRARGGTAVLQPVRNLTASCIECDGCRHCQILWKPFRQLLVLLPGIPGLLYANIYYADSVIKVADFELSHEIYGTTVVEPFQWRPRTLNIFSGSFKIRNLNVYVCFFETVRFGCLPKLCHYVPPVCHTFTSVNSEQISETPH